MKNIKKEHIKQQGFTIIELLIVIVIVGILVAVSVVSYNGITKQAEDTAVKSELTQVTKKMQLEQIKKASGNSENNFNTSWLDSNIKLSFNNYSKTNDYSVAIVSEPTYNNGVLVDTKWWLTGVTKSGQVFIISPTGEVTQWDGEWYITGGCGIQTPVNSLNTFSSAAFFYDSTQQKWIQSYDTIYQQPC